VVNRQFFIAILKGLHIDPDIKKKLVAMAMSKGKHKGNIWEALGICSPSK